MQGVLFGAVVCASGGPDVVDARVATVSVVAGAVVDAGGGGGGWAEQPPLQPTVMTVVLETVLVPPRGPA